MLSALNWASLLSYFIALILLWRYATQQKAHTTSIRSTIIVVTLTGLILHAIELYVRVINAQDLGSGIHFALGHSISLVALVATLIFVLLSMLLTTINLGLAILPTSMAGVAIGRWLNPEYASIPIANASFQWHIAFGMVAFGLLSLAFAQSLLILIQIKRLKTHTRSSSKVSLISLPPLQSMQILLFQLLWLGFAVLCITLFLGAFLNKGEYGSVLSFNHHTVLNLIACLMYLFLLLGHQIQGWRGRQASIYTIICYSLFLIGYFGPRIVRELIIN